MTVWPNHFCNRKIIIITYSEYVFVALFTQYAIRMRRTILSSMASPAVQYFSTLSHERHDFRGKKVIEHNMYVLIYSTIFV